MHGVGEEWIRHAFAAFDLSNQLKFVPQQAFPDPTFPTVVFPNPEEKGVFLYIVSFCFFVGVDSCFVGSECCHEIRR